MLTRLKIRHQDTAEIAGTVMTQASIQVGFHVGNDFGDRMRDKDNNHPMWQVANGVEWVLWRICRQIEGGLSRSI